MVNKVLYFKGSIKFNSALHGDLGEDNYLVLFKNNSLLLFTRAQTTQIYTDKVKNILDMPNKMVIYGKKNKIELNISKNYNSFNINNLSTSKLERELESKKTEQVIDYFLNKLKFNLIGREYSTSTGFIDLLFNDSKNTIYIIELKNKKLNEKDVNQILRYLKDIKKQYGKKQEIKLILIGTGKIKEKIKLYGSENKVNLGNYGELDQIRYN